MRRDEVLRKIQVSEGSFVVDVGGGHRPFPRADVVIEKFPFDHAMHRNRPMVFPRVPVIKADAIAIPVLDGSCDLLFASHIIEHLPDPAGFIDEAKRISKELYLEFPSRNRELMFAWPFHEWFIEPSGNVLRFYRNDLPQVFGNLFHTEFDAVLGAWSEARHELLNTSIHCRPEEIQVEFPEETATQLILRDSPRGSAKIDSSVFINRPRYSLRETLAVMAQSVLPKSSYERLSRQTDTNNAPAQLTESVRERLMCLRCRTGGLTLEGNDLVCRCGAVYSRDRGVFDFDLNAD